MKKLILGVLLAAALLALLCVPALADEEAPRSGSFGDGFTWSVDSEGTLAISGTGKMPNVSEATRPWKDLAGEIKKVVYGEGITSTGGNGTLNNLTALETVELSSTVTNVQTLAIGGCTALKEITVAEGNESYWSHEGVLYKYQQAGNPEKGSELFCYPEAKTGAYVMPEACTGVYEGQLAKAAGLTELTLSPALKSTTRVCQGCPALRKVTVPEGITEIGDDAFGSCPALESVSLPWRLSWLSFDAFRGSTALQEIIFQNSPFARPTSGWYPDRTFLDDLPEAPTIRVPNFCLEAWQASDWNIYPIEGYELPEAVMLSGTWGDGDDKGAVLTWEITNTGRMTVSGEGLMKRADSFGRTSWTEYASLVRELVIGEGVTNVNYCCFWGFTALEKVTLPEGVTELGYNAFAGCAALTELALPDSLTTIADNALGGCTALKTLRVGYGIDSFPYRWLPTPEEAPELTIEGYERTRAQLYAEENGYPWRSLGPCPIEEVTVTNSEELLAALGSHKRITLADGVYELNTVLTLDKYLELSLVAEHSGKAELLSNDGQSPVVKVGVYRVSSGSSANNVTAWIGLEGLILGHTVSYAQGGCGGDSSAYVVAGYSAKELSIKSCDLWGCGTIAVYLYQSEGVTVEDSILRDCIIQAVSIYDSELTVKNSVVSGNDYEWRYSSRPCVNVTGESTLSFAGCTFVNNHNKTLLSEGAPATEEEIFADCVFYDNLWQEGVTMIKNYGVCLGGVSWQLKPATSGKFRLVLGEDVLAEDGTVIIKGVPGEIPDYSEYSLPWKRYANQIVTDEPAPDVNGDGVLDTRDAAAVFTYVSGVSVTLDQTAADANGDGSINSRDALLLFRRLAK